MGWLWLERNIPEFLSHVLGLVSNPRACPTHVDAVYARKCVNFILRQVIGGILSEKAQITAAKEILSGHRTPDECTWLVSAKNE